MALEAPVDRCRFRGARRWSGAMRSCVLMSRRSWTLLLIVAGVWGGSFMLTAIAIRDLPVPVVALFRTGVGALVLLPIALRRGALAGLRAQLGPVVLLGVVQTGGSLLAA